MKSSWTLLCLCLMIFSLVIILPNQALDGFNKNAPVLISTKLQIRTPAQEVGDTKSFWAVDYDEDEYYQANAYLLAIGDHCYIYIEDLVISLLGQDEANARAATYQEEFDTNIYPRVTDLAGDPDGTLGDIDGDPRVYILIVEKRQSYYRQSNEIAGEHSNMCEMVYICYRTSDPLNTIAHEFHHLVWFNYEFDEVHFILEGAAEYATYYAGYISNDNLTVRVSDFLNDPDDSLIYFEVEAQDYGACYLFAFYLAEQYGEQFLRDLVQHEGDGAQGLETALEGAGHNISFNDLYLDWMTALTIDEQGFSEDRYCLQDMNATIQDYTIIGSLPYQDDSLALYCYGSKVYRITSPSDHFTVEMSQPAEDVAGLSVAYRDSTGWHVQQTHEEGRAILSVSGESITIAHVITSYMFPEVPGGDIDFGAGPRETVQLLIHETNVTTTDNDPMLPFVIESTSVAAIIIVFFLILKRRGGNRMSL